MQYLVVQFKHLTDRSSGTLMKAGVCAAFLLSVVSFAPAHASTISDVKAIEKLDGETTKFAASQEIKRAIKTCERSLKMRADLVSSSHPKYLVNCRQLASLYVQDGQSEKAERMLKEVIEKSFEIAPGATKTGRIECRLDLSALLTTQHRYEESEALWMSNLEWVRLNCGQTKVRSSRALCDLAQLMAQAKHYQEADRYFKRALEEQKKNNEFDAVAYSYADLYKKFLKEHGRQ